MALLTGSSRSSAARSLLLHATVMIVPRMTTAVKNSFLFMGIISPPHAFKYGFPGKTIAQKNNPLLSHVESADILIVTHLSQIGGSLAEVVKTVDWFIN